METIKVECKECGKEKEIPLSEYNRSSTKNFFCNNSCAAKYNNKHRKVQCYKSKNVALEPRKMRVCKNCGKLYNLSKINFPTHTLNCCCKECSKELCKTIKRVSTNREKYSIGGRHSILKQKEKRRSKNEQYFCELCQQYFTEIKNNEPIFNGWDADVIIGKLKIAILWNGKWHYEQISKTASLEQIQNRDKIKIIEIQKCGYIPYIIKDMGKYNPKFVEQEFQNFLTYIKHCGLE